MATGQLEEEPGVDRAEDRAVRPLGVAQQPLDLGPGEIGVDGEAGPLPHQPLLPGHPQLVAARRGAAVLPDEGPVHRLPGGRVPGDHRLALVGDSDPVQGGALDAGGGDRLGGDAPGRLPDLVCVVLDPAGPRKVLPELRVGAAGDTPAVVEDDAGRPRRPLVDGEDHGVIRSKPGTISARTLQLRVRVEERVRPSAKAIEARAKGKTAPGKPAGAAQAALR